MRFRTKGKRSLGVAAVLALATTLAACAGDAATPAPTSSSTTAPPPPEPTAPPTTRPRPASTSSQRADVDGLVAIAMEASGAPGAVVGVWAPGHRRIVRGYGTADLATGEASGDGMWFRLGTATKPFTCSVLLQLVDEEVVGLDDPIGIYIDNVPNPRASLRQLCQGTSGLPDYATPAFAAAVAADPTRTWSPSQLNGFAGTQVDFAPGQGWYDSNTAMTVLGTIIEDLTERSMVDNVRERVIDRLRIPTASYPPAGEVSLPEPSLHGYWSPTPEAGLVDYSVLSPSVGGPAGAMVADLEGARALVTQLAVGNLVSDRSHAAQLATVPIPDAPEWLGYGLGVVVMGPLIGHDGVIPGYASAMFHEPATGATFVVVLTTSNAGSGPALALVANLAAAVVPQSVPWGLGEVSGRYGGHLG